jgi:hypothetical protein
MRVESSIPKEHPTLRANRARNSRNAFLREHDERSYHAERSAYIRANKLRFLRPDQLKAIYALQSAIKVGKDRFLFEMDLGDVEPKKTSILINGTTPAKSISLF